MATLVTPASTLSGRSVIARVFDDPSVISQILVVRSPDPETINLPSVENASE
jgi:hypothetical protein